MIRARLIPGPTWGKQLHLGSLRLGFKQERSQAASPGGLAMVSLLTTEALADTEKVSSSLVPLWGGKCVTWRIPHILLLKKTSRDWKEPQGLENQPSTSSREDLFLAESQVRLLLWLGVEIMLLHLLTEHVGFLSWCKLASNSTVLHLILFLELCENDAFYGERKKPEV